MANYCPQYGAKVEEGKKFCSDCGFEVDKDPNTKPEKTKTSIDRTGESILAFLGGTIGVIYGIYVVYVAFTIRSIFSAYTPYTNYVGSQATSGIGSFLGLGINWIIIVGFVVIIAGIISIIAGIEIRKNTQIAGILLLISTIIFILSMSIYAIGCGVLTGIAGILLLARK